MFSIQDIIELAIQIERNGEAVCRSLLEKNIDPSLARIFAWMAEEEKSHVKWFEGLKETIRPHDENSHLEEMGRELLNDVLGAQSFTLGEIDLSRVEQVNDLIALLIDFEGDTVLFYEMNRTVVSDPETLEYLDIIIKEEKKHKEKLQAYLQKGRVLQ